MTQPSTTRRKFLQWLGLAAAMPAIAKAAPASEPATATIDPNTRFIDVRTHTGQSWLIAEEAVDNHRSDAISYATACGVSYGGFASGKAFKR